MYYIRENIWKILILVLLLSMLIGLFVWVYVDEKLTEESWSAAIAEAEPYEREKRELEQELNELKETLKYSSDEMRLMIGFLVSDTDDYSYIRLKSEEYGFNPVIVLDCMSDVDHIASLVEAADAKWEIMLYADSFSSDVAESAKIAKAKIAFLNRSDTGIFLLRRDLDTVSNVASLLDGGFIGYTTYQNSPYFGQNENGSVYIDYSYVRQNTTAIFDRIQTCYYAKSSSLIVLDMDGIAKEDLTEDDVIQILNEVRTTAEKDDCSISTVSEVVAELSQINQIKAEAQAAYDIRAAEIEARINELDKITRNIYANVRR